MNAINSISPVDDKSAQEANTANDTSNNLSVGPDMGAEDEIFVLW